MNVNPPSAERPKQHSDMVTVFLCPFLVYQPVAPIYGGRVRARTRGESRTEGFLQFWSLERGEKQLLDGNTIRAVPTRGMLRDGQHATLLLMRNVADDIVCWALTWGSVQP